MNFGGLLGIVAVLAFGVGILGVAFAFTLASQGRSARGGVLLALVGFVGGVVLFVISSGILIVQPARAAVIVNVLSGELEDPARAPGTSIIIPGPCRNTSSTRPISANTPCPASARKGACRAMTRWKR